MKFENGRKNLKKKAKYQVNIGSRVALLNCEILLLSLPNTKFMASAPVFTGGTSYFLVEVYTPGFKNTFINSYWNL